MTIGVGVAGSPRQDPQEPPTRWDRAEHVVWRAVPSGVLLLGSRDPAPVLLSGAGAIAWTLLDAPIGEAALIDAVAGELAVAPELVALELRNLLEDLGRRNLVVHAP